MGRTRTIWSGLPATLPAERYKTMGRFADIPGNGNVKKALAGMVDSGRIPHAILMYENDGCGALMLAQTFMQYANCTDRHDGEPCGKCPSCNQFSKMIYPDLHYTFPITTGTKVSGEAKNLVCDMFAPYWRELVLGNPYFLESELSSALGFEKKSGQILVAEGHDILKKLSMSAVSGGYRAIIMYLPESMNTQTANMLLKAIEEPSENTVFILVTHSPESVLPTISSRCQGVRVLPLSKEEVSAELQGRFGAAVEDADMAASLSGGSVGLALRELSEKEDVSVMKDLLRDLLYNLVRKDLKASLETGEAIASLESREKQKLFCNFAAEALRNIFLLQQGLESIAAVSASDAPWIREIAGSCSKSFSRKALDIFSKASMLIDRNVSQKMVFANVVDRLYMSI